MAITLNGSTGLTANSSVFTDSSGNVGIGTSSPTYKIDTTVSGSGTTFNGLRINNGTTIAVLGTTGASYSYGGASSNEAWLYTNGYNLNIGPDGAAALKFVTNGSERARIDSSGNVGIGCTPTQEILEIKRGAGSNCYIEIAGNNNAPTTKSFMVGQSSGSIAYLWNRSNAQMTFGTNSTERLTIDAAGTLTSQATYDNTASGSTVVVTSAGLIRRTSSSLKYKKDIETLDSVLADNAVANLRPVWYRSKNAEGDDKSTWSHIGLIAEEVDLVEPRLVRYKTVDVSYDDEGKRVETLLDKPEPEDVDYARLSVLLLDVVKRQQSAIASLEARVAALEAK